MFKINGNVFKLCFANSFLFLYIILEKYVFYMF